MAADVLHVTNDTHIGNSVLEQFCLSPLNLHTKRVSSSVGSGVITEQPHSSCHLNRFPFNSVSMKAFPMLKAQLTFWVISRCHFVFGSECIKCLQVPVGQCWPLAPARGREQASLTAEQLPMAKALGLTSSSSFIQKWILRYLYCCKILEFYILFQEDFVS